MSMVTDMMELAVHSTSHREARGGVLQATLNYWGKHEPKIRV